MNTKTNHSPEVSKIAKSVRITPELERLIKAHKDKTGIAENDVFIMALRAFFKLDK